MAIQELQQILNSNTLEEGKTIINENFQTIVDFLDTLTEGEIQELVGQGLLSLNLADKLASGTFTTDDVALIASDGNYSSSGVNFNRVALLEGERGTSAGKIPANQWIDASQTRLYVDTNLGDDSNAGTDIAHPFKTIKAAAAAATPGTSIFVAAGNYTENNPIVLPQRVSIIGDDLRNVRLYAQNDNVDFFHVNSLNYLYGLRFMYLRRPAFAVAFPSVVVDCQLDGSGGVDTNGGSSIPTLYSPTGYTEAPEVYIDPPESENGVRALATANIVNGQVESITITNSGSGYLERPRISIAAPSGQQPFIVGSPYIQNCSSITGPFDVNGKRVSEFVPLPYDVDSPTGFTAPNYFNPVLGQVVENDTYAQIDPEGAAGGMKIDGRVCQGHNNLTDDGQLNTPRSPLRSMVADAFTQVNQGGPGFLVTNEGYAQFVSCFTTFSSYSYKAKSGGFANVSNSVSDFGTVGLVSEGYARNEYTAGTTAEAFRSDISSISVNVPGSGYASAPTVTLTGGGPNVTITATATAFLDGNGGIDNIVIDNPGSGYTEVPTVQIEAPSEPGGVQAVATANLSRVGNIEIFSVENLRENTRPDINSIAYINDQWVTVTNVQEVNDATYGAGFSVSFYPPVNSVGGNLRIPFHALSSLSTGAHVFEFVGSGFTYNALPEYGGVPDQSKEVLETSPGKVYFSSTDNAGNFRVGDFFQVEQSTGTVTLNTNAFNLSGLNQIGPFASDGVTRGVAIEEATNNVNLQPAGAPETNTVASVSAIKNYVSNRSLNEFSDVYDYNLAGNFSPITNQVLKWNGTSWQPNNVTVSELSDTDFDAPNTPQNGLSLTYRDGSWIPDYPDRSYGVTTTGGNSVPASTIYNHINNDEAGITNPHNVTASDVGAVDATSDANVAFGYARLDGAAKVPANLLPSLSSGTVYVVNDIPERDALTNVNEGDIVRVLDTSTTFIYTSDNNWVSFGNPESVTSVNGQTGDVNLTTGDLADPTNRFFTNSDAENVINQTVTEDFVNAFDLQATSLRGVAPDTSEVTVGAYGVYEHLNTVFDANAGGRASGENPHGITPTLIGAYPNTATTDDISEGSTNLYYNDTLVQQFVDKAYVDNLDVDALTLGGVSSLGFLRSNENDKFTGILGGPTLNLSVNGEPLLAGSDARLQVNGLTRSGAVYLHATNLNNNTVSTANSPLNSQFTSYTNVDYTLELTWGDHTVWHTGNMGAGRGLDADLLDGLQSTDFMRSTGNVNETIVGNKTFEDNVDVQERLFAGDIQLDDGGNIGTDTTPSALTLAADGSTTFSNNVVVAGDLTVQGTTTTVNTTNTTVEDQVLLLASGQQVPSADIGFVFQRYATPNLTADPQEANVTLVWDEDNDKFVFGATDSDASTGEISITSDNEWVNVDSAGVFKNQSINGTVTRTNAVFSDAINKIIEVTESEYNALSTAGTLDSQAMYVIINV